LARPIRASSISHPLAWARRRIFAGELYKQRTGIDATHVPYRSIGQSYPDMMANKVQFAFSSIAGALPFTTDNRVRAIATTGTRRSPVYPDLPTVDEAGLKGFEVDLWLGIFAPAGIPADALSKLKQRAAHGATERGGEDGARQGWRRAARHDRAGERRYSQGRVREVEDRDHRRQDQAGN